jgi:hypothetical protein
MTLEKGFYAISDEELFLFVTNGFWDMAESLVEWAIKKEVKQC